MKRTLLHYAEKLKKPLHILTAFSVIICTAFAFPNLSFANDYNNSFAGQPLPLGNENSDPASGFLVYRESPQSASTYVRTAYSSSDDTYVFYVSANPVGNSTQKGFVYATPNENTTAYTFNYYDANNSVSDLRYQALSLVDSQTGYYFNFYVTAYGNSENLPSYTTISEGLSALNEYIENSSGANTPYDAYFDLPCGNVAYIRTGDSNTLTLSCTMPEYSSLTGSTGTYWTNTMQIAYGVPSYPPAGTTFPLSSMSNIQWFRSTEGRDLLGRTKQALFLDTTYTSDNFIVVYNPTYREFTTQGQGNINPSIRIRCSELIEFNIYALSGEFNSNGTISSYSIDNFQNPYNGVPTSDNENVIPSNTNGGTPSPGGSGNEVGGNSITDYVQQINNTLNNFVSSFINLLKAPIAHISQLVSAGSDFVSQLGSLYSWLPAEVYNTLTSAIILCITVGVLKVLL